MVVKTAIVQIDGAYRGKRVVTQHLLGVDKPRCVLKNAHPVAHQPRVVGAGDPIDHFFVGNAGRYNPHIHPAQCRQAQLAVHFIADNQVRGGDIQLVRGAFDHIQVHVFGKRLVVHRAVGIGLYKAIFRGRIGVYRQITLKLIVGIAHRVPHFQKHSRQAFHCVPFQSHAGVFPIPVRVFEIEIFVCQIVSARKTDLAVNHGDFAVVAVVHKQVEKGNDRVENPAGNADFFHPPDKSGVDKADTADVVIQNPHFHPGARFFCKNRLQAGKGLRLLNGMILQKNKTFRFFQIPQLRLKPLPCLGVKRDIGVGKDRERAAICNITALVGNVGVLFSQPPGHCRIFRDFFTEGAVDCGKAAADFARQLLVAEQQKNADPEDRKSENQKNPR